MAPISVTTTAMMATATAVASVLPRFDRCPSGSPAPGPVPPAAMRPGGLLPVGSLTGSA